ncbi:hypothetical protein CC78DRAFT_577255 [Lojkania enalia]|uniref:Uncharacterized protein n=1 Tax=Lojkania enalia TaxID=147567 RepID=A0A9P4KGK2_9PLEO|nr:hypothetical protein CC78DRAFT_577255 [Didymosphaeria enalia]
MSSEQRGVGRSDHVLVLVLTLMRDIWKIRGTFAIAPSPTHHHLPSTVLPTLCLSRGCSFPSFDLRRPVKDLSLAPPKSRACTVVFLRGSIDINASTQPTFSPRIPPHLPLRICSCLLSLVGTSSGAHLICRRGRRRPLIPHFVCETDIHSLRH